MIYYFNEVVKDDIIYSCDMIRINFKLFSAFSGDDLCFIKLREHFNNDSRIDVKNFYPNFMQFKFKNLLTVDCGVSSYSIGFHYNGIDVSERLKGFIEFNPNKIKDNSVFISDFNFIRELCYDKFSKTYEFYVVRWDLAIDFSIDRNKLILIKDSRKYRLDLKSEFDKTEYLGCRNDNGFVKLYNKQIESNLDYPLTRLELTFDSLEASEFIKYFPKLLNKDFIDSEGLTNTLKVMLFLLIDSANFNYYFSLLHSGKNKQLLREAISISSTHSFVPDLFSILSVIENFRNFYCV